MKKAYSSMVVLLLLTSMLTLASSIHPTHAVTGQTPTGWYWPAGADDISGQYGFLSWSSKRSQWHLAQDFNNGQGLPVYAIADGEVVLSRTDIGGYGPNGAAGGALVARFETSGDVFFIALYGHLDNPHAIGKVEAGQILGYTNAYNPPHLHFGIHPGYGLPANPWQGYTSNISLTYGWVDPVQFLLSNHPFAPANPSASFTITPSTGALVNETITFDASASINPDGAIVSYEWNFGDSNSTTTAVPIINHVYSLPDTYYVTLTEINDKGLTDSCSSSVNVQNPSTPIVVTPIVASVSADLYYGVAPLTVHFSGSGSGGVPPYSYLWVFGDGSPNSTVQNPSHTYSRAGSFTTALTVTDSVGGYASKSVSIEASAQPIEASAKTVFISISTESTSTAEGSPIRLSGRLLDSNGIGLQNKSVVLSYNLLGANSWTPIGSTFTDSVGSYVIQWNNTESGTFTLKASWTGDTTYSGASRTTTLSFLPYPNQEFLFVESNSTVSVLAFNNTSPMLSFEVSGSEGTSGYVKATMAKSLMPNGGNLTVYFDGNQLDYTLTSTANSWVLAFNYTHSTHQVRIAFPSNDQVSTSSTPTFVSTPTFNSGGGSYSSAQSVTVQSATPGSTIRYTVDGSEPSNSSTEYSCPIVINSTTTIKAKAFASGMTDSNTTSAYYIITSKPAPTGGNWPTYAVIVVAAISVLSLVGVITLGGEKKSARYSMN